MVTTHRLKGMLPTREGVTLRVGTEVAVTDEFTPGWQNVQFRLILVAGAKYHVRVEDLAFACGEL